MSPYNDMNQTSNEPTATPSVPNPNVLIIAEKIKGVTTRPVKPNAVAAAITVAHRFFQIFLNEVRKSLFANAVNKMIVNNLLSDIINT
ncbi:6467_t:CDS:1, partial [Funneliformis geosporum]